MSKDEERPGAPKTALAPRPEPALDLPAERQPLTMTLPSGRSIEAASEGGDDTLRILAPGGTCVLTVQLTAEGPVLRFEGASLQIAAAKRLELSCEELSVRASGGAAIDVGGDLEERVGGSAKRAVRGTAATTATRVDLEATPGGIDLRANDDVRIQGERVMLNSDDPPMPLTWDEYRARQASAALPAAPTGDEADVEIP
ncbi:hypothetical protein [Polyangium aurulentum]|uniref:hypothetical protein n=1 Tax=Polyangium aurulentum TaxID=2567896 RepID=UPI0010ADE514|nr:hypothetical protein [Polyangium aurulentum]UQA54607.1 hypothetical protein E8A73_024865 [Polyangium aurulentum]